MKTLILVDRRGRRAAAEGRDHPEFLGHLTLPHDLAALALGDNEVALRASRRRGPVAGSPTAFDQPERCTGTSVCVMFIRCPTRCRCLAVDADDRLLRPGADRRGAGDCFTFTRPA
jgi:hypothetical protein